MLKHAMSTDHCMIGKRGLEWGLELSNICPEGIHAHLSASKLYSTLSPWPMLHVERNMSWYKIIPIRRPWKWTLMFRIAESLLQWTKWLHYFLYDVIFSFKYIIEAHKWNDDTLSVFWYKYSTHWTTQEFWSVSQSPDLLSSIWRCCECKSRWAWGPLCLGHEAWDVSH